MKRTLSLLAASSLLLFGVACGDDTDDEESSSTATSEPTETPDPTPSDPPSVDPTPSTGGGLTPSGDRPGVAELTDYIYADFAGTTDFERQMAECMAQVYYDSDISDAGLREFVDDYDNWEPEMEDAFAFLDAATQSLDCIPGADMGDLDLDF